MSDMIWCWLASTLIIFDSHNVTEYKIVDIAFLFEVAMKNFYND